MPAEVVVVEAEFRAAREPQRKKILELVPRLREEIYLGDRTRED